MLLALGLFAIHPALRGADFSEWTRQAEIPVPAAGLARVPLPPDVLDASRADLADLRLADPSGRELPFLLRRLVPVPAATRPVKTFLPTLADGQTVLTLETGVDSPVEAVVLQTPESGFIKAVRVEGSPDGKAYRRLADGLPVFRLAGATELTVRFPAAAHAWIRLLIDDERSRPMAFTGAGVRLAPPERPPEEPVPATVKSREEIDGDTRLVLDLGAAHLPLASLELQARDPLFQREVSVRVAELVGEEIRESELARDTLYAMETGTGAPHRQIRLAIERTASSRELVVLVRNGDSPPLDIQAIRLWRRPVELVFPAATPGRHRLFTGNPRCPAPRYDLASLSTQLATVSAPALQPDPLQANPAYRPAETLPGLAETAGPLDPKPWRYRKAITLREPGVQVLELDPDVLSRAQAGLGDLRLVLAGRQVPYLIERPSLARGLAPEVSLAPDPRRPRVSRWKITLSHTNLPITRLECRTRSPLFQRSMRAWEEISDLRAGRQEGELGRAEWRRQAGDKDAPLLLDFSGRPRTSVIFLETDNGDNPALELESFRVTYPAPRLIFKASTAPELYYGNPEAVAPHYDVALVAGQLLAADRSNASPGPEETLKPTGWTEGEPLSGVRGWIFWGVLTLVVGILLYLLARLLPAAPGAGGGNQ